MRATTTKQEQCGITFGDVVVSKVSAGGFEVKGKCLLDDGPDTTLVSEPFMKKLRLRGKKTTLQISGIGSKGSRRTSSQVTLHVRTPEGSTEHDNLNACPFPTSPPHKMMATREQPSYIYSDNDTNVLVAKCELKNNGLSPFSTRKKSPSGKWA